MDKSTRLAYDRTWLSYERTMQAWIRTAISLITFGFSVYKLADIVAERNPAGRARLAGPHQLGFALVGIGLAALAMAAVEYRQSIAVLREEYGQAPRSKSVILAGLIAAMGIFALISMIV